MRRETSIFLKLLAIALVLGNFCTKVFGEELYIVGNKEHIALVVRSSEIDTALLPYDINYEGYQFIDISIGQDPYFYLKKPSLQETIMTFIKPAPLLLRLHPYNDLVESHYKNKEVVRLVITPRQLKRIMNFTLDSFKNDRSIINEKRKAELKDEVKYFYPAKGMYRLNNTCTTWLVTNLKQAGIPIFISEEIPHLSPLKAIKAIAQLKNAQTLVELN